MNKNDIDEIRIHLEKFMERISSQVLDKYVLLKAQYAWSKNPIPFNERKTLEYKSINEEDQWGYNWESAWFQLTGTIPPEWNGNKVVARLDFSGEGLVCSNVGKYLQGITNGSVFQHDFSRDIVPLYEKCNGGEEIELWVETAANGLFGMFTEPDPDDDSPNRYGHYEAKVNSIRLYTFDSDHWHHWLDLKILWGMLKTLEHDHSKVKSIASKVSEIIEAYNTSLDNSREIVKILLTKPAEKAQPTVTAVGHAHIDMAWLWPVRETHRKIARTFASQLALIDKYPDYIFGASQPVQYEIIKNEYPEIYTRIKKAVAESRWELLGGMWIEADCNLISGESLIRQILYGINFFKDEFGVEIKNLWLPDVFGYSAALPQILNKSGIKYFLTQKLSWNQINVFPHHTFIWQGIDGSSVLTHFPPEDIYCSQLGTDFLIPAVSNFKESKFINKFISLFGVGDGGGGPKEENIELGKRMADLEGSPKVKFGKASDLFEELEKYRKQLAVWEGELYLELHRGTYTTQAYVKKANRKLEYLLKAIEFLYSCQSLETYPAEKIEKIWKTVLLNQFHDILPGSSITKVYQVARNEYEIAFAECRDLINEFEKRFTDSVDQTVTIFNYLHYHYNEPLLLPESWSGFQIVDADDNLLPIQKEGNQTLIMIDLAPYSFDTIKRGKHKIDTGIDKNSSELILENDLIKYRFDNNGTLIEAFDKEIGREVIAKGKAGNVFTLYDDNPKEWDAWDIDITYEDCKIENARVMKFKMLDKGEVRQGIKFEYQISNSKINQNVFLQNNKKKLDFETSVDWHERHKMLRVSFPVNIFAEQATFDIQYGYLKRNTHRESSWDKAKFEVVAHKYADLSDDTYGVALINDCKYGHKILGNVLDLNLLRAPTYPDPDADQGKHEFKYAFLPHVGELISSDVISQSSCFNQEPIVLNGSSKNKPNLPVKIEGEGLSLEALKKAEKEDCLIARIVETLGRKSSGKLIFNDIVYDIAECDIMEWNEISGFVNQSEINIELNPFEIRTFKIRKSIK